MRTLIAIVICLFSITAAKADTMAKWTVLVYMNGHNNLEGDIAPNFNQMKAVGSTSQVNIVAQVAKTGKGIGGEVWRNKVFRYRITQNLALTPANATMTLGPTDMGAPDSLRDFLVWGAKNYPAENYAVVLWGHGQGYRMDMLIAGLQRRMAALTALTAHGAPSGPAELHAFTLTHPEVFSVSAGEPQTGSGFRTVSSDDVFGSKLYMSDLREVLSDVMHHEPNFHGSKFALLGFDACLMAMVENAYAFRNEAQYMVGSQDLEPGAGWNYKPWLQALVHDPTSQPSVVGKSIVTSYADTYQNSDGSTTLSLADLSKADALATATSDLAQRLSAALPQQLASISAAHDKCPYYAPDPFGDGRDYFFHVDLGCIAESLMNSSDPNVKSAATRVRDVLKETILSRYAGSDRVSFGSNGLCIYFPANRGEFNGDLYSENGYLKTNLSHPVEFVQSKSWADLLAHYYDAQDAASHAAHAVSKAQRL